MASVSDRKPDVFVRKASGLIRTAGTWDVLAYNINFTSIGLLLLFLFLFGPAFYPGASLPWATVICVIAILPLALVYGYLASAMPRSGGDYVYVSRVLGPAIGMMSNWNMTMWWFFYGGVPSAFLARYGLAPFFRTMGIYTGNETLTSIGNWFTTKAGTFILGACLIILLIVIFSLGTKTYFKIQNILILFAVASTVLTVAVFIGKVPADTIQAFNDHLREVSGKTDPAAYVRVSARDAGFTGLAPFSLFWTLMVMTWIYLNLSFMSSSAYIGSEVKNARKLQLWSMPATLFIVGIGVLISVWVIDHAVGYNFLAVTRLGRSDRPRPRIHPRLHRTGLLRGQQHRDRVPHPVRLHLLELRVAAGPDPERLAQHLRLLHRRAAAGLVQAGQQQAPHADQLAAHDGHREHHRPGHLRVHRPVLHARRHLRLHPELHRDLALGGAAAYRLPTSSRPRPSTSASAASP